jgi:hypothetical protein
MFTASALAAVTLVGQLLAAHDLAGKGRVSTVAFLIEMAGIFFIPTSVILSAAIVWAVHKSWRRHLPFLVLAAINFAIALNFAWFIVSHR